MRPVFHMLELLENCKKLVVPHLWKQDKGKNKREAEDKGDEQGGRNGGIRKTTDENTEKVVP